MMWIGAVRIARRPSLVWWEKQHRQTMTFTKRLREPIMRGQVTCSVRIWRGPHVKVGGHYKLGDGFIEVTSFRRITMVDITPELARRSGFLGVVDLLKVAKHGPGENVYLIEFIYRPGR
jgi:hypothetical protein